LLLSSAAEVSMNRLHAHPTRPDDDEPLETATDEDEEDFDEDDEEEDDEETDDEADEES
jgi:hypothetical protein